MISKIEISFSADLKIISEILALQYKNLRQHLSPDDIESQGFVYVQHQPDVLQAICLSEPAVIATDRNVLAGYALCMNKDHAQKVPELVDFFKEIDQLQYEGIALCNTTYLACGQICIAKEYRGQNLMRSLYRHMQLLNPKYQYCITEVSSLNVRSLHAHFKVGFVPLHKHYSAEQEEWQILLWDWRKTNQKVIE